MHRFSIWSNSESRLASRHPEVSHTAAAAAAVAAEINAELWLADIWFGSFAIWLWLAENDWLRLLGDAGSDYRLIQAVRHDINYLASSLFAAAVSVRCGN